MRAVLPHPHRRALDLGGWPMRWRVFRMHGTEPLCEVAADSYGRAAGAARKTLGFSAFNRGAGVRIEVMCRGCGCSQSRACDAGGVGCHWVEPDLCSVCASRDEKRAQREEESLSPAEAAFLRELYAENID